MTASDDSQAFAQVNASGKQVPFTLETFLDFITSRKIQQRIRIQRQKHNMQNIYTYLHRYTHTLQDISTISQVMMSENPFKL